MTNIEHEINSALKQLSPALAKLFEGTTWERIPNAPSDAGKSMEVYASQAGDVTLLAWKTISPTSYWRFQRVSW